MSCRIPPDPRTDAFHEATRGPPLAVTPKVSKHFGNDDLRRDKAQDLRSRRPNTSFGLRPSSWGMIAECACCHFSPPCR